MRGVAPGFVLPCVWYICSAWAVPSSLGKSRLLRGLVPALRTNGTALNRKTASNGTWVRCASPGNCLSYPAWSGDAADFSRLYNVSEFARAVEAKRPSTDMGNTTLGNATLVGYGPKALHPATNLCLNGRLVPSLYLIGAQKCATSSFANDFAQGDNVVLAEMGSWNGGERLLYSKELHFFDHPTRYNQGVNFWLAHWPQCPNQHTVAADFTPSYISARQAPARIRDVYGDLSAKLTFLVILREPLARMQSSFYHGKAEAWISKRYASFEQYVAAAADSYDAGTYAKFATSEGPEVDDSFRSMTGIPLALSLYNKQLDNWLSYFSPAQFVVAPFGSFTEPKPKQLGDRSLLQVVAARRNIQARMPSMGPTVSHLNVHSHPPLEKDLTHSTLKRIKSILQTATGPRKLAKLLKPAMRTGLTLYGFAGEPTTEGIASYIKKRW